MSDVELVEPQRVIIDATALARMAALTRYGILDTDRDAIFDGIAELASALLDAPIAVVNFIADDRQWFKAEIGIGQRELPLDVSICRFALPERGLFVVPDLTADDRFACNPLVTAVEGLRFYAGMVLESDGVPIGTVCVLDNKPRADGISAVQRRGLEALGVQAMAALDRMATAKRDGYRFALTERLRDAGDAEGMMDAATEMLGQHLCAAQVGFAEVEADQAHVFVHRDWNDGRIPSVTGRWHIDDFGPEFIRDIKAGHTVVIPDVTLDERTHAPDVLERYAGIRVRALLNVGLIRGGLLQALLFTHDDRPRSWTADEVDIVNETVERLWSSVERARAEKRLLQSEVTARAQAAQIKAIYDAAPVGLAVLDRELRYANINSHLAEINGIPAAAHIGKTVREIVPDVADECERIAAQVFATGEPVVADDISGMTEAKPGQQRHWTAHWVPVKDASGVVTGISVVAEEITERKQAEAVLQANAQRYRTLIEATSAVTWSSAPSGLLVESQPLWTAFTGQSTTEILGTGWTKAVHPDDAEHAAARWVDAVSRVEPFSNEHRIRRHDGEWRWMRVHSVPVYLNGDIAEWFGMGVDITERKRQEEHIKLLMGEVNHRSKNMLGLVHAIAKRTVTTRPEDFVERFGERVRALAANQDLLVRSDWRAVPIGELVRSQLSHFSDAGDARVALDGPPVEVTASASQALGIALHELATNAAKYGALSNQVGRVGISWRVTSDAAGTARFTMSWTESGGPTVAKPTRHGFGSTVIGSMIKMNLGCDADIDFAPTGLVWRIDCAAEGLIEGSASSPPKSNGAALNDQLSQPSARRSVLVVEDEALIAMDIAQTLEEAGYDVIGPAHSVAVALALLAQSGCDAAVLDTNLGAETAEPVARELIRRGKPFIATSGYTREQQPEVMRTAPLLGKPVQAGLLIDAIERCLGK